MRKEGEYKIALCVNDNAIQTTDMIDPNIIYVHKANDLDYNKFQEFLNNVIPLLTILPKRKPNYAIDKQTNN